MAKPARGLPTNFDLSLPDERPVSIGDFLEEEPPPVIVPKKARPAEPVHSTRAIPREHQLRLGTQRESDMRFEPTSRPVALMRQTPRYQLNLSRESKTMLDELVEFISTYSPESDARGNEMFQGMISLLHGAMQELDLADVPRR